MDAHEELAVDMVKAFRQASYQVRRFHVRRHGLIDHANTQEGLRVSVRGMFDAERVLREIGFGYLAMNLRVEHDLAVAAAVATYPAGVREERLRSFRDAVKTSVNSLSRPVHDDSSDG